jgi:hypothetical protein
MWKPAISSTVKRVFKWASLDNRWRMQRHSRKLSDYRATSLAVRLTITGALAGPRVPSRLKVN